jgi:hypothetical protein
VFNEGNASSWLDVKEKGESVLEKGGAHVGLFVLSLCEVWEACGVSMGSKFGMALYCVALFVLEGVSSGH